MKTSRLQLILSVVLIALCLTGAISAQTPDPILGMELETETLSLNVGDTYSFTPTFTTEGTAGFTDETLHLFSSDENVVRPAETVNSVEAVGGGEALLIIYSWNYEFSAVCAVTVEGQAKSVAPKGSGWENPPADQLAKISDPALKAFFEMLAKPEMAGNAGKLAEERTFNTLVSVTPGRAGSLAEAMKKLGMGPVTAIERLDLINVTGTAAQYLYLLESENILSIDENEIFYAAADTMLSGQAEELSALGTPVSLGLSGLDTAIVFLDTGIAASHEQFTGKSDGKILMQACFSTPEDTASDTPACKNGTSKDLTSAEVGTQVDASKFTHGTHVTAIAAGKDGVAPGASIIAINVFHQHDYVVDSTHYLIARATKGDILAALEYVSGFFGTDGTYTEGSDSYRVAAVNLSLEDGKYTAECKKGNADFETMFSDLLAIGIPTVAAAGDSGYDKAVAWPACSPSAFVVGALWDSAEPEVASYSNHAKMVDILAPGTQIYSATEGTNSYGFMNGTSQAAAIVSGSMALFSEAFPSLSCSQIEGLLIAMSEKTAARAGITKPVLYLENTSSMYDLLNTGPAEGAFGGNKYLTIPFSKMPFNTSFKVTVYKGTAAIEANKVKTVSAKNPKSVKITKLVNDQPYFIVIEGTATIGGEQYALPTQTFNGMPMLQAQGLTLRQKNDDSAIFEWNAETGVQIYLLYWTAESSVFSQMVSSSNFTIPNTENLQVYGTAYKRVTKDSIPYYGEPVSLQTAVVTAPDVHVTGGPKKVQVFYLKNEYEAKYLSGRQIEVWLSDGSGNPVKKVKAMDVNITKNPDHVVISGLQNGKPYVVKVRNIMKVGKKTFTSAWTLSAEFIPDSYVTGDLGYLEMYMGNFIKDVTVSAGDKTATVTVHSDQYFVPDGYRIEVKPVEPNRKRTIIEVPYAQSGSGYTLTKLTNGLIYKLRLMEWVVDSGSRVYSMAYPEFSTTAEDTSWPGLYFVPLPAPNVQVHSTGAQINVTAVPNLAADGITAVYLTGSNASSTTADVKNQKWNGEITAMPPYTNTEARQVILMLYKDYAVDGVTTRFYGPAVYYGDPINTDYNYGFGSKAADESDQSWMDLPEFADAAQIDGVINFAWYGLVEKSAALDELAEESDGEPEENVLVSEDDVIFETYDVISFEESDEGETDETGMIEETAEEFAEENTEAEETAVESEGTPLPEDYEVYEYDTDEFEQIYAEDEGDPDIRIEEPDSSEEILIYVDETDDGEMDVILEVTEESIPWQQLGN